MVSTTRQLSIFFLECPLYSAPRTNLLSFAACIVTDRCLLCLKHKLYHFFCLDHRYCLRSKTLETFVNKLNLVQNKVRNCPIAQNWRQKSLRNYRPPVALVLGDLIKIGESEQSIALLILFSDLSRKDESDPARRVASRVIWPENLMYL